MEKKGIIKKIKIVFLYTRLADYFYNCIMTMVKKDPNINVTIIRYAPDKNAPFKFESIDNIELINKSDFISFIDLQEFVKSKNPTILYTAGWSDNEYKKIAKSYRNKIPTIVGLDNPWENSLRQKIGSYISPFFLLKQYSHVWVSGIPQYEFAKRLGFRNEQIIKGLYVANTSIFENGEVLEKKKKSYPKVLLFVGRFVDYKNPLLLVKVFLDLEKDEKLNGWKLRLIGSGNLEKELQELSANSENITIESFIPPEKLPAAMHNAGAFCLPSKNEHWGVVVHEASAAGLPLLLSLTCHSGTEFLISGFNGYNFDENNKKDFKLSMQKLFLQNEKVLNKMAIRSIKLSKRLSQEYWMANLLSVIVDD